MRLAGLPDESGVPVVVSGSARFSREPLTFCRADPGSSPEPAACSWLSPRVYLALGGLLLSAFYFLLSLGGGFGVALGSHWGGLRVAWGWLQGGLGVAIGCLPLGYQVALGWL
jgi:hypothetical protein